MPKFKAFTIQEILIVAVIVAVLSTVTYAILRPQERITDAAYDQALIELKEITRAIQLYSLDNGQYPPEVSQGIDPGLAKYLTKDINWGSGPLPGTVYDYDNWIGQSCLASAANDTVQISLRNVPGRNPDGSSVWSWYASATPGKLGAATCLDATKVGKGECANCDGFDPHTPPS
jgi:competence protein ComGC